MDEIKLELEQLRSALDSESDAWAIRSIGTQALNKIRKLVQSDVGLRIQILAQCSVHDFPAFLAAYALQDQSCVLTSVASYDAIMAALDGESEVYDVYILLPWVERNERSFESNDVSIQHDTSFWRQVWERVLQKQKRVFQVSADYSSFDAYESEHGSHQGVANYVTQLNRFFRAEAPDRIDYIDLNQLSSHYGKTNFYSRRDYIWTKSPFAPLGLQELCRYLWARIKFTTQGPHKVLVLDLDHTLWGGVIGESDLDELDLGGGMSGAAYVDFQKYLLGLKLRGVLLAVASKNNEEDARRVFRDHPEMILKESDIVCFKASWGAKSQMIREIASELNVGLDSVVFFDDSHLERQEVSTSVPEVRVLAVPDEPADFVEVIRQSYCFGFDGHSREDQQRSKYYLDERQRQQLPQSGTHYLEQLGLRGTVCEVGASELSRVAQLVAKTNQFNLTSKRYSRAELESIIAEAGNISLALQLKDSIGDYGMVGVALLVKTSETEYSVDTFLLSCRALARGAEEFLFNAVLERLSATSCQSLTACYIPTQKNRQTADLWNRFGFESTSEQPNQTLYQNELIKLQPLSTYVRAEN